MGHWLVNKYTAFLTALYFMEQCILLSWGIYNRFQLLPFYPTTSM